MDARFEGRDLPLAAFLVALGVGVWLHWSITDPSFDTTEAQSAWQHVLGFSALVLGLAVGAAVLGRTLSQTTAVRRLAQILITTGVLSAVTNVVEDGFGVDAAFFAFALLIGIQLLALVGLAIALGLSVRGSRRLLGGHAVGERHRSPSVRQRGRADPAVHLVRRLGVPPCHPSPHSDLVNAVAKADLCGHAKGPVPRGDRAFRRADGQLQPLVLPQPSQT